MLCLLVLKKIWAILALICSKSRNLTTWQFCFTTLYKRSKLKSLNLLNKSWSFNFDLSYFWCPLRFSVIQCLIGKFLDLVKMGQDSFVVAAVLASVRASWKVTIYNINGALLILNRYALYLSSGLYSSTYIFWTLYTLIVGIHKSYPIFWFGLHSY